MLNIVADPLHVSKSRFALAEFVHPCETDPFFGDARLATLGTIHCREQESYTVEPE
jgi:hypothetical protein